MNSLVFATKDRGFSKGVLLPFKRSPFTLQKESFWDAKGVLSVGKRGTFASRMYHICTTSGFYSSLPFIPNAFMSE